MKINFNDKEIILNIDTYTFLFSSTCFAKTQTCPEDHIDTQRRVFETLYKKQKYQTAINSMSTFIEKYSKSRTCRYDKHSKPISCSTCELSRSSKNKLVWSYSDMALASYKLKDAKQCLSTFTHVSDLGYWIFDDPESKAFQAYKFNVYKCLELENIEADIISNSCDEKFDDCFHLKHLLAYKISNKYSQKPKQKNDLELGKYGGKGLIFIKTFEEKKKCPKIFLEYNNKINEFKVIEGYPYSLTDAANCCNFDQDNFAITKSHNKLQLQLAYTGRDCFGGSAQWFSEEIYDIDLKKHQLIFKSEKIIGFH